MKKIRYFFILSAIVLVSCITEPETDPAVMEAAPIIEELETLPDDIVNNTISPKQGICFKINLNIISPLT